MFHNFLRFIAAFVLLVFVPLEKANAQRSIPDLDYVFQIGSIDQDIANSIAIDQNNNTYITGAFSGFRAVDFNPSPSSTFNLLANNQSQPNFYLAKYASNGNFVWAKQLGSQPGSSVGKKVLIDKRGIIYVIGDYSGTGNFDLDPSSATFNVNGNFSRNIFISKFDTNGNFMDGAGIDSRGEVYLRDAVLDTNANLYLSGYISDTTDLDPSPSQTAYFYAASGNREGFLLQLDSSLNYSWQHDFNASTLTNLAICDNNLICVGNNSSSIDLDPDTSIFLNNHRSTSDIYFSSISSNGTLQWAKDITGPILPHAITVDNKDSIVLLFSSSTPPSIYPDSIINVSTGGTSLLKFSSNGVFSQAELVSTRNLSLNSMVTDSRNNIYATGSLSTSFRFCVDPNGRNECYNDPFAYLDHLFYIMYDENLNYQWSYDLDCDDSDCNSQLITDINNSVLTSGSFRQYLGTDFDPSPNSLILTADNSFSLNRTDIFVSKLIDSCDLYATGIPNLILADSGCVDFQSRFLNSTSYDTVELINYSCDTAFVDSMVLNGGFILQSNLSAISPLDTVRLIIEFSPLVLGQYQDSLSIYYRNNRVLKKCIRGSATQAPIMTINYPMNDTLVVNGCKDSLFAKISVINSGLGVLSYQIAKKTAYNSVLYSSISDSVLALDSQEVYIKLDVSQLNFGFQTLMLFIESDDPLNQLDSFEVKIVKTNVPCSDYSYTVGNCNGFVRFQDRSLGSPTQRLWVFGDGDSSTAFNPSHLFPDSGTYLVSLIVCSNLGCDTISKNIVISNIIGPRAACTPSTISTGGYGITRFRLNTIDKTSNLRGYEDFTCTESTRLIQDSSYTIIANFGNTFQGVFIWIDYNNDGQFGGNETVMPAYVRTGTLAEPFTVSSNAVLNYPLRLRIGSWAPGTAGLTGCNTARGGYKDYTVIIESKIEKPTSKFLYSLSDSCSSEINFIDTSYNFPTSRKWFFGDGDSSFLQKPSHKYATNGIYQVTLITTNSFGSDTTSRAILVNGKNTYSTIAPIVCDSYLSPSGMLLNQTGTYVDTLPNNLGCDSIIRINLLVNSIDTTVSQNGFQLISNETNAKYQWLDCSNGYSVLLNDTNQTFNVLVNGSYSVEMTKNACIDTSNCVSVINVGLNRVISNTIDFIIKPNPTNGFVSISNTSNEESYQLSLYGSNGQLVFEETIVQKDFSFNIDGAKGLYYVKVVAGDDVKIFKMVKN